MAGRLAGGEVIDRILVRVDSQAVTQSLFDRRLRRLASDAGTPSPVAATLETKRAVMEQLVNEALLVGRAQDRGLAATDAEVDEHVKGLRERNQVTTDEEFAAALADAGLSPDLLREQIRHSLSAKRVVAREVRDRTDLREEVLRQAYEREKESWRIPERARVAEILIAKGSGPTGETMALEAVALEASRQLKAGAPFEEVVKVTSSGPTRDKGGDLGFVARGDLSPEIDRVVFSLPEGSVSDPIVTKSGWHLVKVLERTPARDRPFGEVRDKVLVKEKDRQFSKNLSDYLDWLKREAVIEVLPAAAAYYTAPARPVPAPVETKATSPNEPATAPTPARTPGKP